MGNKQSKIKTNKVNQQIEALMLESKVKQEKIYKFVLYGINSSGKTTILKTLNSHYNNDIIDIVPSPNIASNIQLQCLNNMIKLCTMFDEPKSAVALQQFDIRNADHLSKISVVMQHIWQKTEIKLNYQYRYIAHQDNMDIIDDNMVYFFDKIQEIMTTEYIPTKTDIIYHKTIKNGIMDYSWISETAFGAHTFKYIDLSNLIKLSKMKGIFENVAGLIFVVSVADYCHKSRMLQSIEEFGNVVKLFNYQVVLLFFNKYEIFKDCLRKGISLKTSFTEYEGNEYINYLLPICVEGIIRDIQKCIDNSIPDIVSKLINQYIIEEKYVEMDKNEYFDLCEQDAVRYMAGQYLKVFEGMNVKLSIPLHIHRTNALDGGNLDKVFKDIQLDILKISLRKFS